MLLIDTDVLVDGAVGQFRMQPKMHPMETFICSGCIRP